MLHLLYTRQQNTSLEIKPLFSSGCRILFLLVIVMCTALASRAQVVLLSPTGDGGFETGTTFAANGWTPVNANRSSWEIGIGAGPFAGSRGIYTTDQTAGTWAYLSTGARTSHFYRDVVVPAGATNINLSFYWKGSGEANFDRILVYTASNTITPVVNAPISGATAIAGATLVWTQPNVQSPPLYNLASITLPNALAGTTVRLIFTWQNDGSLGTQPGGAIDNISLTYYSSAACSGTPASGTAEISSISGCSATNFTLSTFGLTTGSGVTYQWQSSSSATGPWTNIVGATAATLTTTAAATTYYRLVTTCANGGASAVTNSVLYTVTGNPCTCGVYPLNFASSTADEDITNVTVGTMNNSSTCGAVAPGAGSVAFRYSNYTGSVTGPAAVQGTSVSFSLTMTTCGTFSYNNFFQIYLDWNQDGDFADPGEQVYSQATSVVGNQTVTGTFVVPGTASVGTTRMRIVNIETAATTTNYASTAYTYGETEDYCFTVNAGAACSGAPNAGTSAISASSGCASTNFTLSATGLSFGTGISYQWQSAPSATGPWTNIPGATTAAFTTVASATTFYRLVTTCANGAATNFTNAVSYTVNTCLGSITLTDSFGDGWNGATMTLNVNGAAYAVVGSTFTTGTSQTITFCLPQTSTYSLVYTNSGSFPAEVGVSLTIGGAVVYTAGAGGATVGSVLVSGANCSPPSPPFNDLICNAGSIACGQTINGTTSNATATGAGEGQACGGFTQNQPGVWYSVIGNGNNLVASLCATAWDSRIQVFTGANCNSVTCIGGNDNNGPFCTGNAASYSWNSINGQTYYILISGVTGNSDFSLSLACQTPCAASCNGGPAPANDACGGAQNLGAIPVPAACPNGVGTALNVTTTNLCATAESNYTSLLGCQPSGNQATPAADVWYRFTIVAPVLNVTISGLGVPNVALYEGTNCSNMLPRGCAIGAGGFLNAQFQGLAAGTYYLQVSGGDVLDQCNFTMALQNNYDCQGCVLAATLDATPPPVNGQYQAGTLVTFCYTITSYQQTSFNWLHGVVPTFGPGWDMASFAALPTSTVGGAGTNRCSGLFPGETSPGNWAWYNTNVTSSATGVTFGPGFYFDRGFGANQPTADGNPGNNFGDANPGNCAWTFCWQIRTKQLAECTQDQGLNVNINTTGDGESGSWTSLACNLDPQVTFFSQSNCCPTPTVTVTNPTCTVPTGSAVGQGLGSSPWTYVWKNAAGVTIQSNLNTAGTSNITGLAPGDYTLTVTDATGCASFIAFSIVAPTNNSVTTASSNPTVCVNTAITAITFSTTGATGIGTATGLPLGVTATFTGNATAGTITLTGTPSAIGNYSYSIPLSGGCGNVSATGTIIVSPSNTAGTPSANPTLCASSALTPITITTTGATGIGAPTGLPPGVTPSWSNNVITISGVPSAAGVYNYSIPLTGGCGAVNATGTITVTPPITLNITTTNPSCPSACNGSANVTVTGGAAPYTYTWSGPSAASGANPTNLCVGIYNVTVTGGGCTSQSAAPIPTSCFEIQSILVDACGTPENIGEMVFFQVGPTGLNTANLSASWATTTQPFNGLCTNPTFITNVNATITGGGSLVAAPAVLPPGANVVLITGNTATTSANLFTNLSSTLYVLFQCTQSSSAGHFGNGNGTGIRNFSMTFGTGCTDQVSYTAENLIGSDGASVVYTPSGTPTYINTGCTAPFLPPTAGTIVLTSSTPALQVTASTNSICSGGSATLTATGATSYSWTPSTGLSATTGATVTASPTTNTTYTVTGTTGGCTQTATVAITVSPPPAATIAYSSPSFCTGVTAVQTPTITGSTGGTFSASPAGLSLSTTTGAFTPSTSTAGTYTVTYTIAAAGACPAVTSTVNVSIVATPTVSSTNGVTFNVCAGPTLADASAPGINLSISAGATIGWSLYLGASPTGIPVQTGTGTPNFQFTNATCADISYVYQIIPTINGCNGSPLNIAVIVKPKPISSFTITPSTICVGQSATITFTGATCPAATFTWQGLTAAGLTVTGSGIGPYTVTATAAGTYPIRVQSTLAGCTGPFSSYNNLTVNPTPVLTVSGPNAICSGNATALNLTSTPAGATFNWTQTATNVTGASNGTGSSIAQTLTVTGTTAGSVQYTVTPTLNGCNGAAVNSTVTVNPIPTATFGASSIYRCLPWPGTISMTGTPGAQVNYSINGVAAPSPAIISPTGSVGISFASTPIASITTLTISSISLNGCLVNAPATGSIWSLTVNNVSPTISGPSTVCAGGTANITFTGPPNSLITYSVTGVSPNPTVTLDNNGQATITSAAISVNTTFTVVSIAGTGPLFPSPLNFGTCTVTGVSQVVNVVTSVTPTFTLGPYCQNSVPVVLPASSNNGVPGTWSPATINTATVGITSYTFTPSGSCASGSVQIPITINPLNTVNVPAVIPPVCVGVPVTPISITTTGATGIGAVSNLPPGLSASWNANTIIISGTPSSAASGNYNFSIALAGGCGPVNATGTITVNPLNIAGAPSSSPSICLNTPLTPITIATTGATGISNAGVTGANGLPAGVSASWASNIITISGTPASIGTFNYSIPLTGGCGNVNATGTITVSAAATITGTLSVCPTLTTQLTGSGTAASSNAWVSNNTAIATVSSTGLVTGVAPGTAVITYTNSSGCQATATITVTAAATITGTLSVCPTLTTQLTGSGTAASSNAWVSSNTAIATVSSTGVVTGVAPGSAVITYTNSAGCQATATITVTAAATITGTLTVCPTLTTQLTGSGTAASSNAWVSSNTAIATVSSTGLVTGVAPGTAVITYTNAEGCQATATITVTAAATITGTLTVCPTLTTQLTGSGTPASSNAWVSSNTAIATVSSMGLVTGVAPGTAVITYTNSAGCQATATVAVSDILDFVNLQFPASGIICQTGSFTAYGQIYNTGTVNTADPGQAPGVMVQLGYSTSNTNPSTWTNWQAASFNTQFGENDEYTATLSGLAPGIYYYTFRYQINNCDWQYGGYSGTGGGSWGGLNVNGMLQVQPTPNAGNDAPISVCATGAAVNLFNLLGTTATNGTWTGPSTLSGGNLGTFTPASNAAGAYTYTVPGGACPADEAVVTVTITSSPTATVVYPSPICNSVTTVQVPTIVGTAGGAFSSAALTVNAGSGGFNPSGVAPGTYTVNYAINIAGCSPFQTTASVTIVSAPVVPTLLPANPCALNANTYTAGNGAWYEYFVGGVSTGPASATNTLTPGVLAAGTQVCVRSYPAPTYVFDGAINEPQWGNPLATSAGGPVSGFGPNYLDALYLNAGGGYLYGAIAGQTANSSNNRILLFIDCIAGGYNNLALWTNRSNAPYYSVENLGINGGIVFDPGFSPDYVLCMNQANNTAFWDLYNMATNTNFYLGSDVSDGLISTNLLGYQANGSQGNLTQGFEFAIPLALLGNPTTSIQTFTMLVNDPGQFASTFISNQFLTPAGSTNGNYEGGFIDFGAAPPNPVAYGLPPLCYQEQCVTVVAPATPTFTPPAAICAGQPAPVLPTSSSNSPSVTGTWSGPVSNQASGTYTFTPGAGQCATGATLNVTVNPLPVTNGIFHD